MKVAIFAMLIPIIVIISSIAIALSVTKQNTTNTWTITNIEYPGSAGSIAVDSTGNPHIAYFGASEPMYASFDGTGWNREVISGAPGIPVSLAMDKNDAPHVTFTASVNSSYNSWYGNKTGGVWKYMIVDNTASSYGGSIVIDQNGTIHITYNCNGVRYANLVNGTFKIKNVEMNTGSWMCEIGSDRAIDVDAFGIPHIGYSKWTSSPRFIIIKHSLYNGTIWNSSIIGNTTLGGGDISIKINKSGIPIMTYSFDGNLKYCFYDKNNWSNETIEKHSGYSSIVLKNDEVPCISFANSSDLNHMQLKYAQRNGTSWDIETIDTSKNSSEQIKSTSMALDKNGYVHIAYLKGYELCYATNKPSDIDEFTTIIIPSIVIIALFVIALKRKKNKNLIYVN